MSSRRTAVVPIYCALLLVGGQWPMSSPAYAAAFTVNNISDTHDAKPGDGICAIPNSKNVCTLRAAIDEVNALGGKTTHAIKVPANTYLLFLGELTVKAEVDITGSGAATTIVDGQLERRAGQHLWYHLHVQHHRGKKLGRQEPRHRHQRDIRTGAN